MEVTPTPELSVRFTSTDEQPDSSINVSLIRLDKGVSTNPAPFTPPLDDAVLKEIRWYLEDYSGWPTEVDRLRAERIEQKLEEWGNALRTAVFQGEDGARLWQQFVDDASPDKLLTIDATDPRVLRLPWELLADKSGHIFARRIGVRRRLQEATRPLETTASLPVRILIVVARPDDAGFISPRAVSQPLLEALDGLGESVVTEFLYPPTMAALSERLSDEAAPPVHVVHFDGHGVYEPTLGLGFLLFENDDHKSDLVDAARIGTLLVGTGVPLMVLNACQSAAQDVTNPYASVAARLIRSGVGSVLAMNNSVLVVAARIFVEAFYGGLAAGLSVGRATDRTRRALLAKTLRHTFYRRSDKKEDEGKEVAQPFNLLDWFLPALYQQAADPVVFAKSDGAIEPRREPAAFSNARLAGALPAEPLHGFTGRAKEMLKLERELAARAVVIVHGFGGLGKTTLAAEAARWFWRTGRFPGGAAFVSFEHGGSLAQLCSWVGQAVSGDPNWQIGEGEQVTRVAELLARQPALVILDNFESVIGSEPVMPQEELTAVLDAVWTWAQAGLKAGKDGSRVLMTTRDTHLNDPRYAPGKNCAHLPLGGLAAQDALELAGNILDSNSIDRERVARDDLKALIEHLGGHTLSLYLVLPQLKTYTARQIIDDFETLLPGFVAGKASERNESLKVSLEFSLRRLGEAALPALAVFQGGALEALILEITEIDAELWKGARAELEAAALVTAEPIPGTDAEFLQFHPTLLPALGEQLPAERRPALETRFWQAYYEFSRMLYREDTPHPHQARAMALLEMPNLRRGFELTLAAALRGETEAHTPIAFAGQIGKFLDNFGRRRELEALRRELDRLPQTEGALTKADFLRLSGQGEALRQSGRLAEAEQIFRDLLARLEKEATYDNADYDRGMTLRRLGHCLTGQNRRGEALNCYRQAESIFRDLGASLDQAKQMQAACLTNIGDILAESGRFDEAQAAYEAGLAISRELDDHRGAGVTLGQLGTLALTRGDLKAARERYQEALDTFRALGEPASEATAWHQLGRVEEEAKEWDEAERCYREAARIHEELGDKKSLTATLNQLGLVAKSAGRPADAERWYLQAQKLKDTVAPQEASTLGNLASLYLEMGRLAEARKYAIRTADIMARQDLSVGPWKIFNILADISTREGKTDEARDWRRKRDAEALTEGISYNSRAIVLAILHRLGVDVPEVIPESLAMAETSVSPQQREKLTQVLGEFRSVIDGVATAANGNEAVKSQIEGLFERFAEDGWQIADPIRRIWAGERDAKALTGGLDDQDTAIVLAILHRLGVEIPPHIRELLDGSAGEAASGGGQ